MKFLVPLIILFALAVAGCTKKEYTISAKRKTAIIDSLVALKTPDIQKEADEDLDKRRPIEVKAKIDSILMARAGTPLPVDTPDIDRPPYMNEMQRQLWERRRKP